MFGKINLKGENMAIEKDDATRAGITPLTNEVKVTFRKALTARLDDQSVKAIVDQLVLQAQKGDKDSASTLVRLLDYSRIVASW
jgi:hypothetical protein